MRNLRKGHTYSRGERNGSAKLSPERVVAIRKELAARRPQKVLAYEYGVSKATVSKINTGELWAHV